MTVKSIKTMSIEAAIEHLKNAPRQLSTPEAMAFAAARLLHGPVYYSGLRQSVPEGFAMSSAAAGAALLSLEKYGAIESRWEEEGARRGCPRRLYNLVEGADVRAIAALDICGGGHADREN